jgi:hypothetical protein
MEIRGRSGRSVASGDGRRDLGPVFYALSTHLTWLQWEWRQYRVLYGNKESRLDLLNEAPPFFFRVVQDLLLERMLPGIAKLAGPVAVRPG